MRQPSLTGTSRHGPPSGRRRAARPARPRPARGGDRAAGPSLCIAPAGSRQDDDARRPGRLADRDRDAARGDPGDHLQQARGGRDDRAARCRRRAARGRRPAPSASGRSTRWAARSCATPASPSSRWPIGRGRCRDVAAVGRRRRHVLRLDTPVSPAQGRARRDGRQVVADPDAGPWPGRSSPTRRRSLAAGGLDFDDLILRAIERLEADPQLLGRWRGRCTDLLVDEVQDVDRAQLRARPAAGRPGQPDLPASATMTSRSTAGGWPTSAGSWGWPSAPARAAPGRSRGQLPLPAAGRRAGRPARRAQPRAVRQGDPRRARRRRLACPRAGRRRRDRPPRAGDPDLAGRRLDPRGPGADEPRAVSRRSSSRSSSDLPFRAPRIELLLDRRSSTPSSPERSDVPQTRRPAPLLLTLGRVRRGLRDDGTATRRRGARDGAAWLGCRPFADLGPVRGGRRRARATAGRAPARRRPR